MPFGSAGGSHVTTIMVEVGLSTVRLVGLEGAVVSRQGVIQQLVYSTCVYVGTYCIHTVCHHANVTKYSL